MLLRSPWSFRLELQSDRDTTYGTNRWHMEYSYSIETLSGEEVQACYAGRSSAVFDGHFRREKPCSCHSCCRRPQLDDGVNRRSARAALFSHPAGWSITPARMLECLGLSTTTTNGHLVSDHARPALSLARLWWQASPFSWSRFAWHCVEPANAGLTQGIIHLGETLLSSEGRGVIPTKRKAALMILFFSWHVVTSHVPPHYLVPTAKHARLSRRAGMR